MELPKKRFKPAEFFSCSQRMTGVAAEQRVLAERCNGCGLQGGRATPELKAYRLRTEVVSRRRKDLTPPVRDSSVVSSHRTPFPSFSDAAASLAARLTTSPARAYSDLFVFVFGETIGNFQPSAAGCACSPSSACAGGTSRGSAFNHIFGLNFTYVTRHPRRRLELIMPAFCGEARHFLLANLD